MKADPTAIALALLSHTNAGKTTLARTLLRQDIGAVEDRPHVTEVAESNVLLQTESGARLVLWDTPGFGDSVRLLRRLEQSGNPLGWFLTQVWDRFADRPFWCSQQAMRAARESADVLLYVANATEDPKAAGYVVPELRILQWLGLPTLVLLNQLGARADEAGEGTLLERWRAILDQTVPGLVTVTLPFDAFARCWVQEHALLDAIGQALPAAQHGTYGDIRIAWAHRDAQVLRRSAVAIAHQLWALVSDEERVPESTLVDQARHLWRARNLGPVSASEERAQRAMLERLDVAVRKCTAELVALHGLVGGAEREILSQLGREFTTERAPDADRVGLLGGLLSGALSGLAADLAAGGLTLGAGALIGGIAGALGARTLTQRYNALRGVTGSTVRWSKEFLRERLEAAIVRYLAVAHYGRGRGEFRSGEPDPRWREAASRAIFTGGGLDELLDSEARAGLAIESLADRIEALLEASLATLYPAASTSFRRTLQARPGIVVQPTTQ